MRLIDADALVDTFAKVLHRHDSGAAEMRYGFVKKVIDNAPSCFSSQGLGEWIEDDDGFNRCSECGWEWDESERVTPYCPECGAKMDGGDDYAID